ncbi:MAG: GNAT family N-acetyltransferase [Bacteroidales bacterium]|nr:GNAT family N-acetyltransferase [Bacteroidales bacterium]
MSKDLNRGEYAELCRREGERIPLMARAWWMEAVCRPSGKEWGAIVVRNGDGATIGAMPYQLVRRLKLGFILIPQLTQHGILWTAEGVDRIATIRLIVKELRRTMLRKMVVMVHLAAYMTDEEEAEFRAAGFEVRQRPTYRINDLSDIKATERRFADGKRWKINRAIRQGYVTDRDVPLDELYSLAEECFGARGQAVIYPYEMLKAVYEGAEGKCQIIGSRIGATGELVAAIMMVRDARSAYYLVTSFAPQHCREGVMELTTRECIRWAAEHGTAFDFEGSDVPSVAEAYRRYGSEKQSYSFVTWYASKAIKWVLQKQGKGVL